MNYSLLLAPIVAGVLSQIIKITIDAINRKFSWKTLNRYGGMPSSHAAFVGSLAIIIALYEGLDSAAFIISLIFAILVIRDAVGIRRQLGYHGKILNKLIKELPDKEEYKFPFLQEKLGHTWLEVSVGLLFGVMISLLAFTFF